MYLIFDSETQIHKRFKRTANPFLPENYVVGRGWKKEGDVRNTVQFFPGKTEGNYLNIPKEVDVLVGHNIKFDLLYEMANDSPSLKAFFKRGGKIWCTQYAEYLLRGQQRKYHMCSMDSIIESYGGRKKIDGMKELWEAGVQTADIDPELVKDYLIGTEEEDRNSGDIGNTELIYLGQLKVAKSLGMTKMIEVRMDGLCGTTEMEFNGIKVCIATAQEDLSRLNDELGTATTELQAYLKDIPDEVGFSWGSGTHKSAIIYGGTIRYKKQTTYMDEDTGQLARKKAVDKWPLFDKVPVDPAECQFSKITGYWYHTKVDGFSHAPVQDLYLSGKRKGEGKFKNMAVPGELKVKFQDFFWELPGYVDPVELEIKKLATTDGADKPLYSTDSETVILLGGTGVPFLKAMSEKTRLDKEIGTYYAVPDGKGGYKGMLTCVDPLDNIIHHMLNHSSTVTSRLSSSNPNCQNIPRAPSRVKAMFISRFPDGVVGEIDYSQLEVVVQGMLSGDINLINDLKARIDFHCKRVSSKFNITYAEALVWCKDEDHELFDTWKPRRQGVKEFSFQRAYGAGAATIALATGMSKEDVEALIISEDKMYPGVNKFNASVEAEVNTTAEAFRDPATGYRTFRKGTYQSPTGTMYSFRSYDAPKWMRDRDGVMDTFSPPELKNYPIQGTGGEIVQMVIGVLWRWFVSTDNFGGKAFLVNTVHDCIWFDMHPDVVDEVMAGSIRIMQAVPEMLKAFFDYDCPVPFPVDAEVGPNMFDLHHWKPKAG